MFKYDFNFLLITMIMLSLHFFINIFSLNTINIDNMLSMLITITELDTRSPLDLLS